MNSTPCHTLRQSYSRTAKALFGACATAFFFLVGCAPSAQSEVPVAQSEFPVGTGAHQAEMLRKQQTPQDIAAKNSYRAQEIALANAIIAIVNAYETPDQVPRESLLRNLEDASAALDSARAKVGHPPGADKILAGFMADGYRRMALNWFLTGAKPASDAVTAEPVVAATAPPVGGISGPRD